MRVDYHVHPNLPCRDPSRYLGKFWTAVRRNGLDAIICAEHSFKDPADAYRKVITAKPAGMRCFVFPGAELVTNDPHGGVDVIAFSDHDWYDEHPALLEPFTMNLPTMLASLEASGLQYFIPHPEILGTPLRFLLRATEQRQALLARVPAFETHNGSHLVICRFLQQPLLRPFTKRLAGRLRASAEMDIAAYGGNHVFFAVGSDAHHPIELGYCIDIPGTPKNRRAAFARITSNTDLSQVIAPSVEHVFLRFLRAAFTAFHEWGMRKRGLHEARKSELPEGVLASPEALMMEAEPEAVSLTNYD